MRDLMNSIHPVVSIVPQTATNADTAIVGAIIDHAGYNSACYVIALGTLTDINATSVVLLEEGDASNLSDAAAVADADLIGTELLAAFTFADDIECKKLGYRGTKRYTRLTVTPSGNNSGDLPIAAVCVLGHASVEPTANPPQ
jgi:hypothetical protein